MSGLEIVAGVAAIVSAFNGSVTLFRSWRDKRRERLQKVQNRDLDRSLTVGGPTIQREYDGHFARLGQAFAVGDDRSRAELAGYVIKLQHVIITMMTESSSATGLLLPSLPAIYSTSEDTRTGVVSALAEQYQRMMQASPLNVSPSLDPSPEICKEDKNTSITYRIQLGHKSSHTFWMIASCICGFRQAFPDETRVEMNDCSWGFAVMREIMKCHYQPHGRPSSGDHGLFYCSICGHSDEGSFRTIKTYEELLTHFRVHNHEELFAKGLVSREYQETKLARRRDLTYN